MVVPQGGITAEIRALLAREQYTAIEARLAAYDRAYTQNVACEYAVWRGYNDVAYGDARAQQQVERWVERQPRSRAALLVRADMYVDLGYKARGSKWARETSDAQMAKMHEYFDRAARDLVATRGPGPLHMVAVGTALSIARASGGVDPLLPWVNELLAADPLNYGVRRRLIDAYEPRWGGSFEDVERVAAEAQRFASRNPRLHTLQGFAHAFRGDVARGEKQYREAIAHYSRALEYGDFGTEWSVSRADAYLRLDQPAKAHADVAYAKFWEPEDDEVLAISARLDIEEGRWRQAIPALDRVVQSKPEDAYYWSSRGWAHENLRNWKAAEADYRTAMKLEPSGWRAHHLGSLLFRRLNRPDEAVTWLQMAVRMNGRDADSRRELAAAQQAAAGGR